MTTPPPRDARDLARDAVRAEADLRATRAASRRWVIASYAAGVACSGLTLTGILLSDQVAIGSGAVLCTVSYASWLLARRAERRAAS